jgi:two-component sensor histidine kinase
MQQVRSMPAHTSMPIVLLCASNREQPQDRACLMGADDVVVMPFTARELMSRIGVSLARARRRVDALQMVRAELESAVESNGVVIAELQHRARNLIAIVRSMIALGLRRSTSLDEFGSGIDDRLRALARVQALIGSPDVERISVRELVLMELGAVGAAADGERIVVTGRDALLPSNIVQTLALAVHELCTNAIKYGALASPQGILTVSWKIEPGENGPRYLRLEWLETGLVSTPESRIRRRRGYGRELIERALPYQLGAKTDYQLSDSELRCGIQIALPDEP